VAGLPTRIRRHPRPAVCAPGSDPTGGRHDPPARDGGRVPGTSGGSGEYLVQVVEAVVAGEAVLPPRALLEGFPQPGGGTTRITESELAVGCRIAAGESNQQIAARLHMSDDQVKHCVRGLIRKLGVRDRHVVADHFHRPLAWSFPRFGRKEYLKRA
jgi:DNA-binding CsgD family transcriptional regulator